MKIIFGFLLVLFFSIVVGSFSANRGNHFKDSNDTFAYKEHFDCFSAGHESNDCNSIISTNSMEITYHALVQFASQLMNFEVYKFSFAFIVALLIFRSVYLLTSCSLLSLLYLMLDFRFWEYATNTLRAGLALSLIMVGFTFYFKVTGRSLRNIIYLGPFSHLTVTIFLMIPKRKINFLWLFILFLTSVVLFKFESSWTPKLIEYVSGDSKIYYYALSGKPEYQVPMHYIAITVGSLLFYKRASSSVFIVTANTLYVLVIASFIFGVIGMSHRIAAFMLPFVVISMVMQVSYLSNIYK